MRKSWSCFFFCSTLNFETMHLLLLSLRGGKSRTMQSHFISAYRSHIYCYRRKSILVIYSNVKKLKDHLCGVTSKTLLVYLSSIFRLWSKKNLLAKCLNQERYWTVHIHIRSIIRNLNRHGYSGNFYLIRLSSFTRNAGMPILIAKQLLLYAFLLIFFAALFA